MRKTKRRAILLIPSLTLLLVCLAVFLPEAAQAAIQYPGHGLGSTGGTSGLAEVSADLPTIVGRIVRALLGTVGVIFLVLMIYAGFLWMTAGGNEENVKKARSLIVNSVAGMAIVFAAYAITIFVVDMIAPPPGPETTEESPVDMEFTCEDEGVDCGPSESEGEGIDDLLDELIETGGGI